MARIPYEIVAIEANRIIVRMALAPSWEAYNYWEQYIVFIEVCGWTDFEFDQETLKRIDMSWGNIKIRYWN